MELIIKIDDEIYEKIKNNEFWLSCGLDFSMAYDLIKNGTPLNETKESTHKTCYEAVHQLKKYTETKKNTDKVEISVLVLNRIIKALSQELIDDTSIEFYDLEGYVGSIRK